MFLRRNRVKTSRGKYATYLSIVHNTWDGVKKQSVPFVLLPLGAADAVDPVLADRLTAAMQKLMDSSSRADMEVAAERLKAQARLIKSWVNVDAKRKSIPAAQLASILSSPVPRDAAPPRRRTAPLPSGAKSMRLSATGVIGRSRKQLINTVRKHTDTTLDDLFALRKGNTLLGELSVGELLSGKVVAARPTPPDPAAAKAKGKKRASKKSAKKASRKAGKKASKKSSAKSSTRRPSRRGGGNVTLRTASDRADYDAKLLSALKGNKQAQAISDLATAVGGTQPQLRAALSRLVDSGKVRRSGTQRWTRYKAK